MRQGSFSSSLLDEPSDDEAFGPQLSAIPLVLIQVPTVRAVRQARRPSVSAMARVRSQGLVRPRRRLRREVRLAGSVILMIAPLALAVARLFSASGSPDDAPADFAAVRPPAVWLSIEAPVTEPVGPVVLPGYVLPDDGSGSEEPAHAGG